MLKKSFCLTIILLSFLKFGVNAQILDLASLSSFEAYTGAGAVTNSGTFTGDVGSHNGVITGFVSPPTFNGNVYNANSTTLQAKVDMLWLYIQLNNLYVNFFNVHAPAFGSETLSAGIYTTCGAGSVGGTLTLDGGGDPDAFFILKFQGAFTVGAATTIILTNGTRAANVFWIANGAITVGASSIFKGTFFSYTGAISSGANCDIEGRMLASEGAITIGSGSIANMPSTPCTIPVPCRTYCAPVHDVLETVENFIFYTGAGAVSNASTSGIVGNVGTDAGAISGFASSTHVGTFSIANATTAQAKIDLIDAYDQLILIPITQAGHAPSFGLGETLNEGVYYIGAAGSLAGLLTLDGQNNPNATFIFRFNGVLTVAAQARVVLTGGTEICNVFWISEGAISMGTFSFLRGTAIANMGACTMGSNGTVEGRMLSTSGAIGFSTGTAYNSPLCLTPSPMPVKLISFEGDCYQQNIAFKWSTASEQDNAFFTISSSANGFNWDKITDILGAGNSSSKLNYSFLDTKRYHALTYFRLSQTDFNGINNIESYIAVQNCMSEGEGLTIYPNPSKGTFGLILNNLQYTETPVSVFDILGQRIYYSPVFVPTITLQADLKGVFLVQIELEGKTYVKKVIVTN